MRLKFVLACLLVCFFLPTVRIRLFINTEVISGPDSQRSSEENVVLQEPLEEVHRAFVGQTELRQEQASGLTHVPKDGTAAHLSQRPVQEEARDIDDKVEKEHKTLIQVAQKRLKHLRLTGIKAGLEGTTYTMKIDGREEAKDITRQLQTMSREGHTGVERMSLKGIQEGSEGIAHLTEHSEFKEVHDIKYQQEKELLSFKVDCEGKLKCFFFL